MKYAPILIPLAPGAEERFTKWSEHFGIQVEKQIGDGNFYIVQNWDPVSLFYFGGSMMATPPEGMSFLNQTINTMKVDPKEKGEETQDANQSDANSETGNTETSGEEGNKEQEADGSGTD